MGWEITWKVTCEICNATGPIDTNSCKAEIKAINEGWLKGLAFSIALHLCPICRKGNLPEWWPNEMGMKIRWEEEK